MATEKTPPDWERIEQQYRAGLMSLREIATADGNVTEGAIRKRAKTGNWPRNLEAKIKAKADALVRKDAVRSEVRTQSAHQERETIDANAQAIADIRLAHRTDIRTGRTLVAKMLAEIQGVTDRPDLIEDLQQALHQADAQQGGDEIDAQAARGRAQRLREALDRVISISGRVTSLKGLAESMKTLFALERQNWNMDEPDPGDGLPTLTDAERASRLATLLARARAAADAADS